MKVMDIFETMAYGPAPESATPALNWLKEHQPFGLFIRLILTLSEPACLDKNSVFC
jgi:hypothetical protein